MPVGRFSASTACDEAIKDLASSLIGRDMPGRAGRRHSAPMGRQVSLSADGHRRFEGADRPSPAAQMSPALEAKPSL